MPSYIKSSKTIDDILEPPGYSTYFPQDQLSKSVHCLHSLFFHWRFKHFDNQHFHKSDKKALNSSVAYCSSYITLNIQHLASKYLEFEYISKIFTHCFE